MEKAQRAVKAPKASEAQKVSKALEVSKAHELNKTHDERKASEVRKVSEISNTSNQSKDTYSLWDTTKLVLDFIIVLVLYLIIVLVILILSFIIFVILNVIVFEFIGVYPDININYKRIFNRLISVIYRSRIFDEFINKLYNSKIKPNMMFNNYFIYRKNFFYKKRGISYPMHNKFESFQYLPRKANLNDIHSEIIRELFQHNANIFQDQIRQARNNSKPRIPRMGTMNHVKFENSFRLRVEYKNQLVERLIKRQITLREYEILMDYVNNLKNNNPQLYSMLCEEENDNTHPSDVD